MQGFTQKLHRRPLAGMVWRMKQADTIIHARWIIPVDGAAHSLPHHSLVIHEDRIEAIGERDVIARHYQARTEVDCSRHAVLPGLINAHTHAAMSLFRGMADDLALMDWLQQHIWPAESAQVNEDFVQCGVELAIAEMLRGGITCMNDMYFHPDVTARVCKQAGFRATVGLIALDFPTVWARDADEYLDKGLAVHDQYRDDALIRTAFAPHAPYTVSDGLLEKIRTFADEMDLPIHMHVHETADEIRQAVEATGKRPLARLHELGLLTPSLQAVHMTQLNDEEITLLAETGVQVIHCPESNMKLASGFCPVAQLQQAGINVALGTDGAASNNDLNLLGEMRSAALIGKGIAADATVLPAAGVLRMATLNAARALGLGELTGSLEVGKQADIIAVDFATIETAPVFDPVSHLVYCTDRSQVSDVWVAGKQLMKQRRLTTLDTQKILLDSENISSKFNN